MAGIRKLALAALTLMTALVLVAGGSSALARAHAAGSKRRREGACARMATARGHAAHARNTRKRPSRCSRSRNHGRVHRRRRRARTRSRHLRVGKRSPRAPHTNAQSSPLASAGGACEGATLQPDEANLELVRAATLCLVNRERAAHGEVPLRPDAALGDAAQGHCESMAAEGYFEHAGPDGRTPLERMQESGYLPRSGVAYELAENIAWGSLEDATPAAIVAAWMASPGHRANILDGGLRDSGVGVSAHLPASFAGGETGAIYTQDFGAIRGG